MLHSGVINGASVVSEYLFVHLGVVGSLGVGRRVG